MKGPRKKAEQRRKVLYKRGGRGRKKKKKKRLRRLQRDQLFHDHLNGAPARRFLNYVRVRSESQTEPQVKNSASLSLGGFCDVHASRQRRAALTGSVCARL